MRKIAKVFRPWMFWGGCVAILWLGVLSAGGVKPVWRALFQANLAWLAPAVALQLLYYLVAAIVYQSSLRQAGAGLPLRHVFPLTLASLFENRPMPFFARGIARVFTDQADRPEGSPEGASSGVYLAQVAHFIAFALISVSGLVVLIATRALRAHEAVAAALLFLVTAATTLRLLLGLTRPASEQRNGLLFGRFVPRKSEGERILGGGLDEVQLAAGWLSASGQAFRENRASFLSSLLLSLAAYGFDLAGLAMIFLAFSQPVDIGVMIAGFAMGMLFWQLPLIPQGMGITSGLMALAYFSMGIPAAHAAAIAITFRTLTYWLPMLAGFILVQALPSLRARLQIERRGWNVRLIVLLTVLMGAANLVTAVTPALADRFAVVNRFLPLEVHYGSHLTHALTGFALFLLADGLHRRKRTAWWMSLIVLTLSSANHLVRGLDYELALVAAGLAIWIFVQRSNFQARSDLPSIWQGLRVLAFSIIFSFFYGVAGFYLLDRHFNVNFAVLPAIRQTFIMFTQFYDPGLTPLTRFGRYFVDSLFVVGATTLGYSAWMLARPVLVRQPSSADERRRAAQIVEAHGYTSLARFALFDDKSYFFSEGGSVVAYVVKGGVALVLGDPIGPAADRDEVVRSFLLLCRRNDWRPSFLDARPENLERYRKAGFLDLCIGQEAIVDLSSFTLEGSENKTIRNTWNKLAKKGFTVRALEPPVCDEVIDQLQAISDDWLMAMHGAEKHFTVGYFDRDYLRNCTILVVYDPQDQPVAFTNIVPEYQASEVSIDLMRHFHGAEPGTMEYLFISTFFWAREKGYLSFSLGLSALSGIGLHNDDPAIEKALKFIFEHMNQFYNFKGLHNFKEKFHPHWEPRYLVYLSGALSQTALSMVRADSGDDFVVDFLKDQFSRQTGR